MLTRIRFQKQLHDQLAEDTHENPFDLPEEDVHDLGLMHMPPKLQLKYQYTYDHEAYGAWIVEMPFPKTYEIFPYYGHQYMIKPSKMFSGYGFFIHSIVVVAPGSNT